jgi:hypothetical protein
MRGRSVFCYYEIVTPEQKAIIGTIAVVIAIVSYIPYFRDIFSGKTKPHAFTWLVWAVLNGIAFAGQILGGGGAGAWAIGFTTVATFSIFLLALLKGEKDIRTFDWVCLLAALLSLIPWIITSDPLISVILITIIDIFGFMPTVRKSIRKPNQETLTTYVLSTIKYALVVVALQEYSLVTVLFPLSIAILNGLFVIMLIVRRRYYLELTS